MSNFGYVGLKDESGVAYGVKHVSNKPRVSAMPYTYDIAEGNVSGHAAWTKIGFTPTMTTAQSDLWSLAGVINWMAAEAGLEVVGGATDVGTVIKGHATNNSVQADAGGTATSLVDADVDFEAATAVEIGDCVILDPHGTTPEYGWVTTVATNTLTVAGGFSSGGTGASRYYAVIDTDATTGAHVVKIGYLDDAFAEHSELVVLNGATAVDTINTDYYRIQSFRVVAAGTTNAAGAALSLRNTAGTTTYSYITAGFTRARNSAYTVPAGKTLYVTEFCVSYGYAAAQTHYCRLYTRATMNDSFRTPGIFYPFTEVVCANSSQLVTLDIPTKLIAGVDIKVSGIATTSGVASVALRGWLE